MMLRFFHPQPLDPSPPRHGREPICRRAAWLRISLRISLGLMVALAATSPCINFAAAPATEAETAGDAETSGPLMIFGGGRLDDAARQRFIELAGGPSARIVLIPTASGACNQPGYFEEVVEPWRQFPHQSLIVLHAKDRATADRPEFVQPLQQATGVWFGGGVQTRLAGRYLGTQVEKELWRLHARGGVLAGTSAGAAVMSRKMISGGLQLPTFSDGFGFFPNAIVDQHFAQRLRMPRLARAVAASPGTFGVGIDEQTGLIVQHREASVIGPGRVRFMLAAAHSRSTAGPSLLVRDYVAGDSIALDFWNSAARNQLPDSGNDSRGLFHDQMTPASSLAVLLEEAELVELSPLQR